MQIICFYFFGSDFDHHHPIAASTPASIAAIQAQASEVIHLIPIHASFHTHHKAVVVVSRNNLGASVAAVLVIDHHDLSTDQPVRGKTITGLNTALPIVLRGALVNQVNLRSLRVVSTTSALSVPGALDATVVI
jgi:hypothetical protein